MKKRFRGLGLAAMAALACVLAQPAHATLQVNINGTVSGGVVTGGSLFTDNCTVVSATCTVVDANSTLGALNFAFGAINFNITGLASTSASPIAVLSMTTNGKPLTAPTTLTIAVSDNGFTQPPVPLELIQDVDGLSIGSGGPAATMTAVGYFSASNTNFVTPAATSTGVASASLGSSAGTATSGLITSGATYSLTEFITVNITSVGGPGTQMQVSADLSAVGVPEPTSIAMLGGVLLLTAGVMRRKNRRA